MINGGASAPDTSEVSGRFRAALDWLFSFPDMERGVGWSALSRPALDWDLRRTRVLLDLLGGPDRRMLVVLVAGTKGKGSTAALLASILSASGTRTGLYTKPHLQSYRERLRVDGVALTEGAFADLVQRVRPRVAELRRLVPTAGEPTTFELTTALALAHFAASGCAVAVVEVGLGGRLDATNAADPHVSVITPISHDHMRQLGTRLAGIAREKAGIMRPGRVVVVALQRPSAAAAIHAECRKHSAVFRQIPPLTASAARDFGLALHGGHQRQNAALAIAAARALAEHGVALSEAAIGRGIARLRWPGRFEIVAAGPTLVLDGAHNDGSALALAAALRETFPRRTVRLVVGMMADKDAGAFARALTPLARSLYATTPPGPRALSAQALAAHIGHRALVVPAVADALRIACRAAGPRDVVCLTGSLALVGAARFILELPVPERLWDQ